MWGRICKTKRRWRGGGSKENYQEEAWENCQGEADNQFMLLWSVFRCKLGSALHMLLIACMWYSSVCDNDWTLDNFRLIPAFVRSTVHVIRQNVKKKVTRCLWLFSADLVNDFSPFKKHAVMTKMGISGLSRLLRMWLQKLTTSEHVVLKGLICCHFSYKLRSARKYIHV